MPCKIENSDAIINRSLQMQKPIFKFFHSRVNQDINNTNYHILRPHSISPTSVDSIFSISFGFQHAKKMLWSVSSDGYDSITMEPLKPYQMFSIGCVFWLRKISCIVR